MPRTNMRTLYLYYPSWFGYELNINDSDEETRLYFVDSRSKRPERTITRHFDHISTKTETGPIGAAARSSCRQRGISTMEIWLRY